MELEIAIMALREAGVWRRRQGLAFGSTGSREGWGLAIQVSLGGQV